MKTRLGLDRVEENLTLFKNRNIALVTNYSGVNSDFQENVKVFQNLGCKVAKIFAPEHGIYGIADGKGFSDLIHPVYRIPVVSLYGEKLKPTPDDMKGIDLFVFDIQDVGLRYYTFIYTLANCLESAHEAHIPFVVLDRPNPLGGRIVRGNRIPEKHSSFVGNYRLPIRYGLTIGELARYFLKEKTLGVNLTVVPLAEYTRDTLYPDTGLYWNLPSPALPTFDSVICYSGGCFVESTNLSEGRGTSKPFLMYGAPWLAMNRVYDYLHSLRFEGFDFRTRAFVPFSSKYRDEVCFGIEFFPTDKKADFIPLLLHFLKACVQEHPDHFKLVRYADVERLETLTGDEHLRDFLWGKTPVDILLDSWKQQAQEFEEEVSDLRIYL